MNIFKNTIINKLDGLVSTNKKLEITGWFKDYVRGNLHYLFYYANINDDREFIQELEKVKFIKQEGVMGALARKIEQGKVRLKVKLKAYLKVKKK